MAKRFFSMSLFGGALLAGAAMSTAAQAGSLIEGVWLTVEKSEMTIAPCPEGHCGYITKIVVPKHIIERYGDELQAIGTNFFDYNNKNPSLRDRPIQGLQILTLRQGADPWHYEGEVYNPEDGNTYAGFIEVVDQDRIKLKGCAYMVLCQEQIWTRVSAQ
jgi:uncharacterized protein (DUF2147 family)